MLLADMCVTCFLARPSKDIDIVVLGSGIDMAVAVARRTGRKGKIWCIARLERRSLRLKIWMLNLSAPERNHTGSDSRNPTVEDGTLEDDQNRRDSQLINECFAQQG